MTYQFRLREEPFWYATGGLEFENATPILRPAPNTVDAEAAEPLFSGRVRAPEAPLLDRATLKLSSRFNQATHPQVSGISLAELRTRLERYIDRIALDELVRRANAGTASAYGSDDATLVTLLAHQFQRKTCRTPTVGAITKPCTVDGRIAEDILDALGFVYHTGRTLNAADRPNRVATELLRRVPARTFVGIEPGLTARTWWSYMVSPPWLGLPIKQGVHLVLLKRLRRAQRALMNLPAYAGLSPAELGRVLGLEEEHKGARPGNVEMSMHLFGLAIDISYTRNPWVSNPRRNTARLPAIMLRAARLVGSPGVGGVGITARYLHNLAATHRDTAKIHRILADQSQWLAEYFALAGNAKRLEGLLPIINAIYPDGGWFKRGESLATAARRWSGVVRADCDAFATAVARGGSKDEVRHGFMDLARDLVIALREDACLGWGAVDFGQNVSGDIMHFDCRVEGIGRVIAKASGRAFVPDAGHPCLPLGGASAVQREFGLPSQARWGTRARKTPSKLRLALSGPLSTAGRWFPFASAVIDPYKGIIKGKWKKNPNNPKKSIWVPEYAPTPRKTDYSVYVPAAAWTKDTIELLVFFHGDLGPCWSSFDPDPDPNKNGKKFTFDTQIDVTGRPVVLVAPFIYWKGGDFSEVNGKWTAAKFNTFINEVLENIRQKSGMPKKPTIKRLIIAGHSRAYGILNPLAKEFYQRTPATTTTTGALAKLEEVWALDSTYGPQSARALEVWAATLPNCHFTAVLDEKGSPLKDWLGYGRNYSLGFGRPPNLSICKVMEGHCTIPTKYIGELLSTTIHPPGWCKS